MNEYKCSYCRYKGATPEAVTTHTQLYHDKRCEECHKAFKTGSSLARHKKKHQSGQTPPPVQGTIKLRKDPGAGRDLIERSNVTGLELKGVVYRVTAPDGRPYYGYTIRTFHERIKAHIAEAKEGSLRLFHQLLMQLGPEAFKWEVVASGADEPELKELETYYIWRDNTCDPRVGLNMRWGDGPKTLMLMGQVT